jgi:hypothetical protein
MDDDPKFILFGDAFDGYWRRLRSASGQTLEASGRVHLGRNAAQALLTSELGM